MKDICRRIGFYQKNSEFTLEMLKEGSGYSKYMAIKNSKIMNIDKFQKKLKYMIPFLPLVFLSTYINYYLLTSTIILFSYISAIYVVSFCIN